MFEPPSHQAPIYNDMYGYFQGAQNDIFEDSKHTTNYTCPQSKASKFYPKDPILDILFIFSRIRGCICFPWLKAFETA